MSEFTMVKTEFPNGWKETPFELLFKRLEENGFKTTNQGELSANEMVMDARPHSDLYKIEKDGRCFSFVLNATTNLRNGTEILDSIGGFKNISNKINKRVEFEIPQTGTWTENVPLSNTGLETSSTTSMVDPSKNATSTTNTGIKSVGKNTPNSKRNQTPDGTTTSNTQINTSVLPHALLNPSSTPIPQWLSYPRQNHRALPSHSNSFPWMNP